MAGHVAHAQAELAAALVEIERAGLEDRLVVARVEVAQGDEVAQQADEVTVVAHQALERVDLAGRGLGGEVLVDQAGERGAGAVGEQPPHVGDRKHGHRVGRHRRHPGAMGGEAPGQVLPFGLGEDFARAQDGGDDLVAQRGDARLPGRVQPDRQRQRAARAHKRERQCGDRGRGGIERLQRELDIGGVGRVERGGGALAKAARRQRVK